ncbi:MAG: hypothetical protein ACXW3D_04630 [Caulobacteraceae bacterium]
MLAQGGEGVVAGHAAELMPEMDGWRAGERSGKVNSWETVRALRKDVTAKTPHESACCWTSRRRRRKRMRQFGRVNIPQEAFIAALQMEED